MPSLIQANQITPVALNFMDDEHLHEIDLINRLYEMLERDLNQRREFQAIADCLGQFINDTRVHFANEEHEMEDKGFPEFELHRDKHRAFLQVLEEAHGEFLREQDRYKLRRFMDTELKDWFVKHLTTFDFRLAEFCRRER